MTFPSRNVTEAWLPSEETLRLETLRRYNVLDTPPEAAFERAVSLASRLLQAPMAFVTLVDERRQWYKACSGLEVRETGHSFCAHAIRSDRVLLIPDTALDPRFADSPLVVGAPHVRFYAGAPLIAPGGHRLGTLCVLDTVPRPSLSVDEQATLTDLAASVVSELELRRALAEQARSEALKSAVLESALDSIITIDSAGAVSEWNPAAERLFGYTRVQVLGRELSDLIIPERFRDAHRRGMAHYLKSGEGPVLGRRIEVSALRSCGTEFPCEMAITPFMLGTQVMFTAYLRDLSERKQAEEALATSNNLLRAVLDGVSATIFVKDLEGRYLMMNEAGAQRVGHSVDDIVGRDDYALFAPQTARAVQERDEQVLTSGQPLSYELADPTSEDPFRAFMTTKSVYRNGQGEVVGLIGTSLDITQRRATENRVREDNLALEQRVGERTRELEEAQVEMLERLARAAEYRDDETGQHVRRVAEMSAALARRLGLSGEEVALLGRVAPLHDVGKIGVSDGILLKPGRLTSEEFEVVKGHALIGGRILWGGKSKLVQAAQEVALTHHERWDGTGYPHGLAGDAIPLFGRIVAVADVYDALTSRRPYKRAWTPEEALAELRAQSGRQFDPAVVAALEGLMEGLNPHPSTGTSMTGSFPN